MNRLGDAPIEEQYQQEMNDLARLINWTLNEEAHPGSTGFILMVFPFGDEGRCNYISNADREDIVTLFKEQLSRLEGSPDIRGHA